MVKITKIKLPLSYSNLQITYGFSLIEVLVALAIFSLLSINVTISMLKALQTSRAQYLQFKQWEENFGCSG